MSQIAIFHENFAQNGGAERVAESMARLLPEADVLSTVTVHQRLSPYLRRRGVANSWMQRLPRLDQLYRHYVMLYPFAVNLTNLNRYELVLSSCFGFAKGLRRRSSAVHVCYCHTPPRWLWRTHDYMERERFNPLMRIALRTFVRAARTWDIQSSKRPDLFLANSAAVAERIYRFYGRESKVLNPPVEMERFHINEQYEDFYLVVSRLVGYKRIDLAILAANLLQRPLKIIGDGPDRKRLESLAGPTVEFLGRRSDEEVADHFSRCRALIFPGEEDFGITPLEVAASGRPVVAFGSGGALETVIDGETGVFFEQPTEQSLATAMLRLESLHWSGAALRKHAATFSTPVFHRKLREFLREAVVAAGCFELLHELGGAPEVVPQMVQGPSEPHSGPTWPPSRTGTA